MADLSPFQYNRIIGFANDAERYYSVEYGAFSQDKLSHAKPDVQHDVMKVWFRDRFEDPAHSTPFESAEGGYI